jgi:hypothetical protein
MHEVAVVGPQRSREFSIATPHVHNQAAPDSRGLKEILGRVGLGDPREDEKSQQESRCDSLPCHLIAFASKAVRLVECCSLYRLQAEIVLPSRVRTGHISDDARTKNASPPDLKRST